MIHIRTQIVCAAFMFLMQALCASDDTRIRKDIPSLLPDGYTINNAVVVFQAAYHYARKNESLPVVIGPCSPCIGGEIIDVKTGDKIYVHLHCENNSQELITKINKYFNVCGKHEIDIALFTRTDMNHCCEYPFATGSHEKELIALADIMQKNYIVRTEHIYYHQTDDLKPCNWDDRSDRWIIFIDKKLYRFDPWKLNLFKSKEQYAEYGFAKIQEVCKSHFASHGALKNVPLCSIKNPNLREINGEKSFMQKIVTGSCVAIAGAALGLLAWYMLSKSHHKTGDNIQFVDQVSR